MLQLPNGYRRSEFCVSPKNWEDKKDVDLSRDWNITYRFYDTRRKLTKQVMVKGMNYAKNLKDRQKLTRVIMNAESEKLEMGYNPIAESFLVPHAECLMSSKTPFLHSLSVALSRLSLTSTTKRDIRNVIAGCTEVAHQIGLRNMNIGDIRRSHVKAMLNHCYKVRKRFTDNTFNHYRAYLNMLFNELLEVEAIESNPVKDIKKKQVTVRPRPTLSDDDRIKVNEYLLKNHATFHRFLHIFFHSGARITELMKVRAMDVDLKNQRYTCEILKGKKARIVQRTIKDIALPLWEELLENAKPEHFIFSRGLKPGEVKIEPYQVTKRWYRLIKKGLGITADFYSLKHSNTTEVVDRLGDEAAARLNEHTSPAMVVKIYDVKRGDRQHEQLKKINNPFV